VRFRPSALLREALESGRPAVATDYRTDHRASSFNLAAFPTVVSAMAVPLIVDDDAVGVLAILWACRREVSADEVAVATALGQHAAVAVSTARLAEEERRSRAELEAVLDAAPDAIYIADADGRLVRMNRRAREAFVARWGALPASIGEYRAWVASGSSEDHSIGSLAVEQALDGRTTARESAVIEPDGARRRFHIVAAPVHDDLGAVSGAVVVTRDVTELHEAVADRARLDGAVKTARRVAHELNGHLGPVLAYADMLAGGLSGEERDMARDIATAAEAAAATIDRLQQIARFEETASPIGPMLDLEAAARRYPAARSA
jgi:PAS domain-containing protein